MIARIASIIAICAQLATCGGGLPAPLPAAIAASIGR